MVERWVWASLLLVLGLAVAVLEIFVPSGGILGFLAVSAIVGSVILAFMHSMTSGVIVFSIAIIGLPIVIALALKWWPYTAIGRKILLIAPKSDDVLPDNPKRRHLKELVGKTGKAKSQMLPGGVILIEGRSIDAVSEGMPIEAGQPIQVVQIRGLEVIVRAIEQEQEDSEKDSKQDASKQKDSKQEDSKQEASKQDGSKQEDSKQDASKQDASKQDASKQAPSDDPLSQPIDSFALDPFEEEDTTHDFDDLP